MVHKWKLTFSMLTCFIFIAAAAISSQAEEQYIIKETHKEAGLSCADCHMTDKPEKKAKASVCIDCHESYQVVAERTKSLKPNPHDSHQGELRCTYCHSSHGEDKLYCNQCHELNDYKFK